MGSGWAIQGEFPHFPEGPDMSSQTQPLTGIDLAVAGDLAAQLRVDSIRSSTSAGSGHPTSSMSAADLLAVLSAGTCTTTGTTRAPTTTTT
jgi:hypothetical protein